MSSDEQTKNDLDLDFTEIQGKTEKKPSTKDTLGESKKTKKRASGITLSIPTDDGYVAKDMLECTAEEFMAWAHRCYPGRITKDVTKFESLTNRRLALRQIERFHTHGFSQEQLNTQH
jgi:hypothetical protein